MRIPPTLIAGADHDCRTAAHVEKRATFPVRELAPVLVVCAAFGLYSWAIFAVTFIHDGALGPRFNAPGADFTVFHTAARAYFEGNLPLIFNGWHLTQYLNAHFAGWLSGPLPFHPWLYPPSYLLLLLPFGLLPFGLSYAAFVTLTLAALVAAVWRFARPGYRRGLLLASVLLSPAAAITAVVGQNAFLTAALLVGGFGMLERRPLLAGGMLGILTFKPQFWLMVPVALIAGSNWRALTGAVGVALALALASAAVFGIAAWHEWLSLMLAPPPASWHAWLTWGRMAGQSIYTCARVLGLSAGFANVAQLGGAGVAAAGVFWAFRRPLPRDLRLVVLLAATVFAAPHVSGYDTILLAAAAGLALDRGIDHGIPLSRRILTMAVWLLPPFAEPRSTPILVLLPLLIIAFVLWEVVAAADASAAAENGGTTRRRLACGACYHRMVGVCRLARAHTDLCLGYEWPRP